LAATPELPVLFSSSLTIGDYQVWLFRKEIICAFMTGSLISVRIRALPLVGVHQAHQQFEIVVLPAPLGPRNQKISPSAAVMQGARQAWASLPEAPLYVFQAQDFNGRHLLLTLTGDVIG
jgi:hypothetical protein